jgi:hypothetical protein
MVHSGEQSPSSAAKCQWGANWPSCDLWRECMETLLSESGMCCHRQAISVLYRHATVVCHKPHSSSENLALLDSGVTHTPFVKVLRPQKKCVPLYGRKNTECLSVGLLRIDQVFPSRATLCIGGLRQIAVS